MRVIFFSKYLELDAYFRNAAKMFEKYFRFLDNPNRIACGKFSLLQRKHLSSTVNVLTNVISHITNRDILKLNFPQTDEKI